MNNHQLESTAERKARRNKDIKTMFQQLTIQQNMPFMEAYEVVGYHFYESATTIRRILATLNKKCSNWAQFIARKPVILHRHSEMSGGALF